MQEKSVIVKKRYDSSNRIKKKYEIPLATQKLLLQICWAQHDGQWFLKSKKEFGIKQSNHLNQKVVFSIGKIEGRHFLNALGIKKGIIKSIPELFQLINTIVDVIYPKVMRFKVFARSKNKGKLIVDKCFIWKEVQKSKEASEYECACLFRLKGWIESTGINVKVNLIKRFSYGDNCCEFKFILNENKE